MTETVGMTATWTPIVRADRVMKLRQLLDCLTSVRGLMSQSEETLRKFNSPNYDVDLVPMIPTRQGSISYRSSLVTSQIRLSFILRRNITVRKMDFLHQCAN